MKALLFALISLSAALVANQSYATIPADPRTIAGIDHISPQSLGNALSEFCRKAGCVSKLTWHKNGDYGWDFFLDGKRLPAGAGSGCAGIPHNYCVQTVGPEAKTFMDKDRVMTLKKILEAKGAKVTLMDCQARVGRYVCADGKPPP